MAKGHKPVAGSRGFWPRKRAKRIYPAVKAVSKDTGDKVIPLAFAGYKAGMTQVSYTDTRKGSATSGQEIVEAATVMDCPPLVVVGIKLYREENGRLVSEGTVWEENLPKDLSRKLYVPKKPQTKKDVAEKKLEHLHEVRIIASTKPREAGFFKKKPEIFEIPVSGDVEKQWAYAVEKLGKEIRFSDVFAPGEMVDASAVTKGKGFAGVVKRFGVKIRDRKSGGKRRHVGNIGAVTPGRVLPGAIAMAGQLGFQTRTEYKKRILKVGDEGIEARGGFVNYGRVPKDYAIIEGSVPGPKKRLVIMRRAARWTGGPQPVELNHVSLEQQQ
ncbi:MAG: 50S ribosomal protein L3 [Candidatus Aenigmatarchaeota archaeon]|nr:MAG: 50S ribosomal protein L3 [Candidatus Aenigmarchaeota archaeon]